MTSLEDIRAAAHAELERRPRVWPWAADAAILVGLNVALVVGFLPNVSWAATQHAGPLLRWLAAGALMAVGVVGGVAAVRPGWAPSRPLTIAGAGTAVGLALIAASGLSGEGPGGHTMGWGCARTEVVLSVLPAALTVLFLGRFTASVGRMIAGGLAAGTAGIIVLHFHCPNGELMHLVEMHFVPWLVIAGVTVAARMGLRSRTYAP